MDFSVNHYLFQVEAAPIGLRDELRCGYYISHQESANTNLIQCPFNRKLFIDDLRYLVTRAITGPWPDDGIGMGFTFRSKTSIRKQLVTLMMLVLLLYQWACIPG